MSFIPKFIKKIKPDSNPDSELIHDINALPDINPKDFDIRLLIKTVIGKHFSAVQIADDAENGIQIGVLESEQQHLINTLLMTLSVLPIDIRTKVGRRFHSLNITSIRKIYQMLDGRSSWTLDLQQMPLKFLAGIQIGALHLAPTNNPDSDIKNMDLSEEKKFPVQRVRISFWKKSDSAYETTGPNIVGKDIPLSLAVENSFFVKGKFKQLYSVHNFPLDSQCNFPIDVVYTWVNHEDPEWQKLYKKHSNQTESDQLDRYFSRNEILYSIRSVEKNAPWVNAIHIVSNCSPPSWLNINHPKINWVDHSKIMKPEHLPTFNSHAIEANLHHIPNLSEHFIYFNDDMFIGSRTGKENFFFSNGVAKAVLENYGVVTGSTNANDPDYLNAARNGKDLIEKQFGVSCTQLHRHRPYCLSCSVLQELENTYEKQFEQTSASKFRAVSNLSVASFLYHHYAYHMQKSLRVDEDTVLLKIDSEDRDLKHQKIIDGQCVTFCLNDGKDSTQNEQWHNLIIDTLETLYPVASSFENKKE